MSENDTKVDSQGKKEKGFSWLGLLFPPLYYSGYGKIKKGFILALLSTIPILGTFGIPIYAGFKAKSDLPIGEVPFKWGNVIIMIVLISLIYAVLSTFLVVSNQVSKNLAANITTAVVNSAWSLETTKDPMTDKVSTTAFKEFVNGSIMTEVNVTCSEKRKVAFRFDFYINGEATPVKLTGYMGNTPRYRINLTSFVLRIGSNKAMEGQSPINYSNEVTHTWSSRKIKKGTSILYKFFLEEDDLLIKFSSDEAGLFDILNSCGYIKD